MAPTVHRLTDARKISGQFSGGNLARSQASDCPGGRVGNGTDPPEVKYGNGGGGLLNAADGKLGGPKKKLRNQSARGIGVALWTFDTTPARLMGN